MSKGARLSQDETVEAALRLLQTNPDTRNVLNYVYAQGRITGMLEIIRLEEQRKHEQRRAA